MVYNSFNALFNSICFYFVQDFYNYFHERYWSRVSLSCNVFIWLRYQDNAGLKECVLIYFICFDFLERLQRIGIISSLNVWQNSPVKPSGPGALCFGRLLIIDSIFKDRYKAYSDYFSLGEFRYSLSLSRNQSISSKLVGIQLFIIFIYLLFMYMRSVIMTLYSFLILVICVLSLIFLRQLARGLLNLLIFSKNQLLNQF